MGKTQRVVATLALLFFASVASAQGTADIGWTARDNNGDRTLKINMTGVTGGTVKVLIAGQTLTYTGASGLVELPWADGGTVVIVSSNGKKVTMTNKSTGDANQDGKVDVDIQEDESGYDPNAAGPELSLP